MPKVVLHRQGKSRLDTLIVQAFDRNRLQMRDLLCDGHLCRVGLLDGPAIAAYLARPVEGANHEYPRILDLVDAELWTAAVGDGDGIAWT